MVKFRGNKTKVFHIAKTTAVGLTHAERISKKHNKCYEINERARKLTPTSFARRKANVVVFAMLINWALKSIAQNAVTFCGLASSPLQLKNIAQRAITKVMVGDGYPSRQM